MPFPITELCGSPRYVMHIQSDPVNRHVVFSLSSDPDDDENPEELNIALPSDPYFNSAASFPDGVESISLDPVNKEQLICVDRPRPRPTEDNNIVIEKKSLPLVPPEEPIDSDSCIDSDDSDYEERPNVKRRKLSIKQQILKHVRYLREHSLAYQRLTFDAVDSLDADRKRCREEKQQEIQMLETILEYVRK